MTIIKVKEVPSPSLSPTQILELTKEEGLVWKDLAFTDIKLPGTLIYETFLATILGISQATNKDHVQSAINSFANFCLTTSGRDDAEKISTEIARLKEWLARLSEKQQEVEYSLEEIDQDLSRISESRRKVALTDTATETILRTQQATRQAYIELLIPLRTSIQERLKVLEHYARALDTVAKGFPRITLSEILPPIPEFKETAVKAIIEPQHPAREKIPITDRREALCAVGKQHGLLEVEVLVYSLFDFFGPNNNLLERHPFNRSLKRTVTTLLQIAPDFGWSTSEEVFAGSGWNDKEIVGPRGYIRWVGSIGHLTSTWVRTEKPLPWNPRTLFSDTEIGSFVGKMRERLPKRE